MGHRRDLITGAQTGAADAAKGYVGLHHEIFNDPESEAVLADIRAWLAERVRGRVTAAAGGVSCSVGASGGVSCTVGASVGVWPAVGSRTS